MRRDERGDAELLAAYVDGVSELSLDERKRVDDLLARDPALRAAEGETRDLIGKLRELPPVGGEPDWNALERSISDAVGDEVPRPWWQRLRWRFIVPAVALAMTAAILALVMQDPEPTMQPAPPQPIVTDEPAPIEDDHEPLRASIPLWLDGTDLDVALEAAELFDLEWELDEAAVPETAELLPPTDLEWIDELESDELDRVDEMLDRRHNRRGPS